MASCGGWWRMVLRVCVCVYVCGTAVSHFTCFLPPPQLHCLTDSQVRTQSQTDTRSHIPTLVPFHPAQLPTPAFYTNTPTGSPARSIYLLHTHTPFHAVHLQSTRSILPLSIYTSTTFSLPASSFHPPTLNSSTLKNTTIYNENIVSQAIHVS